MRICHVITKPELGGAQLSTLNLILNLPKDKYQISVITSPRGILNPDFKNLENSKAYFSSFLIRQLNPILDILALIHIYLIYRSNEFKIIHTHSSKAGIVGRWAAFIYNITIFGSRLKAEGSRVVHTVHGWPFNDYQPFLVKRFYIFLERITATFTTKIICVSKKDIETGLKYKIAPRDKFVLIKYGIPLDRFKNSNGNGADKKRELGVNNNDPVVGMISCLKPQKSPVDYVRACITVYSRMPNVNFLLIGDGVLRNRCKSELKGSSLNGRFIFTGWRKDISDILDIIDIVVLTSKWEGLPIAIIEALSKGKPVVATDAGGMRELVKDGITGYITRPGDYKDTAERILSILENRDSFLKMQREAAESIDDSFDINAMAINMDNLYRRLA
ncbi:MAG: glycosyltransferase family 4 protein [Candidatus Omnitrophota bacterium]|nr:glycosyltransferase family 4 protein [Candidatus Omnitrophota bacterium]